MRTIAIRSSPGCAGPGTDSRSTPAARESARSENTAATASPIPTATMRSKDTVMTAVTTNAIASARVDRRTERTVMTLTIRTAVTNSIPASAASGIRPTSPETASTNSSSTAAWTIADERLRRGHRRRRAAVPRQDMERRLRGRPAHSPRRNRRTNLAAWRPALFAPIVEADGP